MADLLSAAREFMQATRREPPLGADDKEWIVRAERITKAFDRLGDVVDELDGLSVWEQARPAEEMLGFLVRQVWLAWAHEQPNPKPSWLVPYADLPPEQKEVDRRIGMTIAKLFGAEQIPRTFDMIRLLATEARCELIGAPSPATRRADLHITHLIDLVDATIGPRAELTLKRTEGETSR